MLRLRNLAALSTVVSLSLAFSSCGQAVLSCNGSVEDQYNPTTPSVQYGHVTCVTSQLDKEVTDGGE